MPHAITVETLGDSRYRVTVDEGRSRSVHEVTVTPNEIARYAPGATAERLLEASFDFLLAREPKEAILSRFGLSTIERYIPEYAREIRQLFRSVT